MILNEICDSQIDHFFLSRKKRNAVDVLILKLLYYLYSQTTDLHNITCECLSIKKSINQDKSYDFILSLHPVHNFNPSINDRLGHVHNTTVAQSRIVCRSIY